MRKKKILKVLLSLLFFIGSISFTLFSFTIQAAKDIINVESIKEISEIDPEMIQELQRASNSNIVHLAMYSDHLVDTYFIIAGILFVLGVLILIELKTDRNKVN